MNKERKKGVYLCGSGAGGIVVKLSKGSKQAIGRIASERVSLKNVYTKDKGGSIAMEEAVIHATAISLGKENARRSATIKGWVLQEALSLFLSPPPCSLFFSSFSPLPWLQPSLFSSPTRTLFINVKHSHARVPHCTIYAFRLWESGKLGSIEAGQVHNSRGNKNLIDLKSSILVNTWRDKISRDIWDISNEFLLFERTLRERLNYVSHINRTFVQHGLLQPGGGRHFKDATQVVLTRTWMIGVKGWWSKSRRGWIYMDRNSNGNGEVSFHPSINSVLSSVSRIPS